ncbi:hypothetical protein DW322_09655 [Rhodococcus rhodnii]|uniref:Uncharacterized protein n=2 Tax=Rhodococcus rhodnii TaxID=38312 RepID=R7WS06_9NOCA|nr:hypothetical protein [Rhodococcus rhodnii]EOM78070.1 hypothetical protein Rrhod_0559 [Rhodococcus rhodnii LMG 5362]TXG90440.1 hypothetical protein DW322_09655 [Rhodococcus rhodnii]
MTTQDAAARLSAMRERMDRDAERLLAGLASARDRHPDDHTPDRHTAADHTAADHTAVDNGADDGSDDAYYVRSSWLV